MTKDEIIKQLKEEIQRLKEFEGSEMPLPTMYQELTECEEQLTKHKEAVTELCDMLKENSDVLNWNECQRILEIQTQLKTK